jgi:Zn-dependent protease with chaperone function
VTRPLLALCDEDELAFVLGHEMGHVLLRHAIDRVMAHSALNAAVGRLAAGGGVFGRSLAGVAAALLSQGYSQDQELDADRAGVRLARAAGFDPAAGARLLGRLAGVRGDLAGLSRYFSSHPPFEVRISHLGRVARG